MGFHEIWEEIEEYMQKLDVQKIKQHMSSAKPVKVEIVP